MAGDEALEEAAAQAMCARIGADWAPPGRQGQGWTARVEGFEAIGSASRARRGRVDFLHVRKSGNFGNNYIQLMNALVVAEAAGVRRVTHRFDWFEEGEPAWGLKLVRRRRPQRRQAGLAGAFFLRSNIAILREAAPERFLRVSDEFLAPRLSVGEAPVAPVCLNLRGGTDVFDNAAPHGRYGQPPLSFYQLALRNIFERHGRQRVVVVHQDERNPVLVPLLAWLAEEGVKASRASGGPEADARMILGASHLVMGRTTFTAALAMMSKRLESLSVFREVPLEEMLALRVPHFYRVEDSEGRYFAPTRWRNSDRQRRMMVEYPMAALSLSDEAITADLAADRAEGRRLRRAGRRRRLMAMARLGLS